MELVIVTFIIALVAGISIPRFFGSIEKAELQNSTGKISAIMRAARARAVAEKKIFSVIIDVQNNKIFAVRGSYDSFEKPDMIAPEEIPDSVKIQTDGENSSIFEFRPSGGSSGGQIYITGADSRSTSDSEGYFLTVDPLSGKVKILPISEADGPL